MSLALPARGLLFDSDGVLVDSDASVLASWSRWARAYRLDPDEVAATVHGRRSADTVRLLIPPDLRAEALTAIDAFELEDAAQVTAIPGAAELLTSLPHGSWTVVTSATRALAVARLEAAGLPVPSVLVTADDVTDGKPHPEGYLAGAAVLGIPIGHTVVLEDSTSGVEAARRAGTGAVVGVSERALPTDADVVVPDLRSLRWSGGGLLAAGDRLRPATASAPAHGR
ncbi:HAD-IA family hydrolase [Streptomyces sp. NPDC047042]|uniref:HAD-IA family hydrolase n=1 Tax=Streptomyces sp. NPDC047042 TaxID=3154807 RepID=UPI00340E9875